MTTDTIPAWVGAITGPIALALGFYNAWHSTSTRVEVSPQLEKTVHRGVTPSNLCIRIVNSSSFAVRVAEVGIVMKGGISADLLAASSHDIALPVEMPARSSLDFPLSLRQVINWSMTPFDHAFVKLETGKRFRSSRFHRFAGKTLVALQEQRNNERA